MAPRIVAGSTTGDKALSDAAATKSVKWTLDSTMEEDLLQGNLPQVNMKLNDFLRGHLGGRGVEEVNKNVSMDAFVVEPGIFITDNRLLNVILAMPSFKTIVEEMKNREVQRELLRKAERKLKETGVYSLQQWDVYDKKEQVIPLVRGVLNAALSVAKNKSPLLNGEVMTEAYESVLNVTWSHVVEVPGHSEGVGMEVREGKPSREWTDSEVGYLLPGGASKGKNKESTSAEGVADPQELCVELMVLHSEKGWPYDVFEELGECDCYVTREVDRVWKIVETDIENWLVQNAGRVRATLRLLIGTPGIGKSMGVGSYLLYQLLHYDKERLPVVAYFVAGKMYLFDKVRNQVRFYRSQTEAEAIISMLSKSVRGYIIYDVAKQGSEPSIDMPPSTWGMILLSSPNEVNFKGWEKQKRALRNIINCPSMSDLRAMSLWIHRDRPAEEQEKEWKVVEERINNVGPIPRYIFGSESEYNGRLKAVETALTCITPSNAELYFGVHKGCSWQGQDLCQMLGKITRYSAPGEAEYYCNDPLAPAIREAIRYRAGDALDTSAALMSLLLPFDEMVPKIMEKFAVVAFLHEEFVKRVHKKLKEIVPEETRRRKRCVLEDNFQVHPASQKGIPMLASLQNEMSKIQIKCRVLYKPSAENFPLVDGFFFVELGGDKIMVGLQVTTASRHDTKTSTVLQFKEYLSRAFDGWEVYSRNMSWEIIYVQHTDSQRMTRWQRCDLPPELKKTEENVNRTTEEEELLANHKAIAAFWNDEVRQYVVQTSSKDTHGSRSA
ncbi:retrotransposon hot spot (RHS) protein [Trypanosoma grayi]|uniref:retrotransposon hot spot (RHS) protein n=1 Tax=Trypanosoma grayi TaxID=71804 RepID=UPI0004F44965|nr:retrotransposon hot spot (RHS) protein [Trypanosoma grayi]KEG11935.1 retrotransposon hot spot (RHS) protein [Trypanosoma grayi]